MTRTTAVALTCAAYVSLAPARAAACPAPIPQSEKDLRTPAQQKIDSQLLYEIYRRRGEAEQKGVPLGPTGVKIDRRGRALVDVRAEATAALRNKIRAAGGIVVSTSREYRSTIARIPLLELEKIAGDPGVVAIAPAPEATTVR
jgi:hypothetical protein